MDRWIDGSMDRWIEGSVDRGIEGSRDRGIEGSRDRGIDKGSIGGVLNWGAARPKRGGTPWRPMDRELGSGA